MREHNGSEPEDRSVAELVKQLAEETRTLVTREIELAKAELAEKGKRAGLGAGMFGTAGLLGLFAFAALTACFVLALATAIDAWLAALVVAAVYGAAAGVLALAGKKEVREAAPPVPEQTLETLKEDVRWTRQRARAGRR